MFTKHQTQNQFSTESRTFIGSELAANIAQLCRRSRPKHHAYVIFSRWRAGAMATSRQRLCEAMLALMLCLGFGLPAHATPSQSVRVSLVTATPGDLDFGKVEAPFSDICTQGRKDRTVLLVLERLDDGDKNVELPNNPVITNPIEYSITNQLDRYLVVEPGETLTVPYNIAFAPIATGESRAEFELHFHADGADMPEKVAVFGTKSLNFKGEGVCQEITTVASSNLTFVRTLAALTPYLDTTALGLAYGLPVEQRLTLDDVMRQPGILLDILEKIEQLTEIVTGALEENDESNFSEKTFGSISPMVEGPLTVERNPNSTFPNQEPITREDVQLLSSEPMRR